ncbi:MAG TPA: hypothetical protein VL749_02575 [Patescibacteria group bacterium]|nr:hypothetical protein [Patescibacteria group bacterium]
MIASFDENHPDVEGKGGDDKERQDPAREQDQNLAALVARASIANCRGDAASC